MEGIQRTIHHHIFCFSLSKNWSIKNQLYKLHCILSNIIIIVDAAPTVIFIQDDMQLHASRGKIVSIIYAISMIWLVQENEGSERVADLDSWVQLCNFHTQITNVRYPFHKNIPQLYLHKNNADNSIKIAFTNSELPKIICTLFTSGHKNKQTNLKRRMSVRGRGDFLSEIVRIILELRSQIRSLVLMRLVLCG